VSDNPQQLVMQIGIGYALSSVLHVATKLDIADKLANGPKSTADLAKSSGVLEAPLYRALRALASVGIFKEVGDRTFENTPASDVLRTNHPQSLRKMAEFICEPFHFRTYAETLYSLQSGKPAGEKVAGMPLFEYFPKNPELGELFNDAMTNFSASLVPAILEAYDFSGINTIVDVAGGHGMVVRSIVQKYPSMRGILFDMPHVIERAQRADRLELIAGDFFKSVPSGGDAYVMKHIIHDWDDEHATMILKNIKTAMGGNANARVLLFESVIKPGNDPDFAKILDIEMMLFPGGKERTDAEYAQLFAAAGFKLSRIVPTKSPLSVIEATPA